MAESKIKFADVLAGYPEYAEAQGQSSASLILSKEKVKKQAKQWKYTREESYEARSKEDLHAEYSFEKVELTAGDGHTSILWLEQKKYKDDHQKIQLTFRAVSSPKLQIITQQKKDPSFDSQMLITYEFPDEEEIAARQLGAWTGEQDVAFPTKEEADSYNALPAKMGRAFAAGHLSFDVLPGTLHIESARNILLAALQGNFDTQFFPFDLLVEPPKPAAQATSKK